MESMPLNLYFQSIMDALEESNGEDAGQLLSMRDTHTKSVSLQLERPEAACESNDVYLSKINFLVRHVWSTLG